MPEPEGVDPQMAGGNRGRLCNLNVGMRRRLVGAGDAREERHVAAVRQTVMAFGITLSADFDRRGEVDDEEPLAADCRRRFLTDGFVGGDKGGQDDDPGVVEELGDLSAAAQVFAAFFGFTAASPRRKLAPSWSTTLVHSGKRWASSYSPYPSSARKAGLGWICLPSRLDTPMPSGELFTSVSNRRSRS